jgi:broad specificity phosphatase PhoE
MTQTIWIARHGNREDFVDSNWIKTADRPFDPGLSLDGIQQAKELAQRLASEKIDRIFASPFLRTVQTADYVAEALNLPIKIESGVAECLSFPFCAIAPKLLPREILAQRFPRIDLNYRDRVPVCYPETLQVAKKRAGDTITQLTQEFTGNLLIITHGASLVNMTRKLVGSKAKIHSSLCCLIKLVGQREQWQIELNGDTSHLTQPKTGISFHSLSQIQYIYTQEFPKRFRQ